jgi:hemolysin III
LEVAVHDHGLHSLEELEHLRSPTDVPPRLRGVLHSVAFVAAPPVGVALVLHARGSGAQVGAAVFAASVTAMLGVSGLFHRGRWSPSCKRWIGLLDHAMIYTLIAGTYTPFALLVLRSGWQTPILAVAWSGAVIGTAAKLVRPNAPPWVAAALCLGLGWIAVVVFPQILASLGFAAASLLLAGGIAYSAGAIVYARRRPDPFPHTFGYHEIFHVLVVLAVVCQYVTVAFFVLPRA